MNFLANLKSYYACSGQKQKKKIVLAGDFNINTLKKSNTRDNFLQLLQNYNLHLHISEPTRQNSCIDLIISNLPDATSRIHHLGLSDHDTAQSLEITVKNKKNRLEQYFIQKRDLSTGNIKKFIECLQSLSWSDVFNEIEINKAFNVFYELFTLFYNMCFPIIKKKIVLKRKNNTWVTRGIRIACKIKRQLRINYYKNRNSLNKTEYKKYSVVLKKCINHAQKITNKKYIIQSNNKCRASWNLIKSNENTKNKCIDGIVQNNRFISDPEEMAAIFSDYFTNNTSEPETRHRNDIERMDSSMFLYPTDEIEISKIVASLRNTNAVGYDGVSTNVIKSAKNDIAPILSYLVNLSFVQGIFPDKLKIASLKPIYKKDDKERVQNYRPIALIPILSKIFEKAMHIRIMNFINRQDILDSNQNGFQKGKSTVLSAFRLVSEIMSYMDRPTEVVAIFIDMSKAFDMVSHEVLLSKCEKYGLRGKHVQLDKNLS